MSDMRLRPPASDRARPNTIPTSQARAVDRRQSLNEQQRAFRGHDQVLLSNRNRPPS